MIWSATTASQFVEGENAIARCRAQRYSFSMGTVPCPWRVEKKLQDVFREGTRRTPHKKQELIRITLRRHLRPVIEQEAAKTQGQPLTNIEPCRRAFWKRLTKGSAPNGISSYESHYDSFEPSKGHPRSPR